MSCFVLFSIACIGFYAPCMLAGGLFNKNSISIGIYIEEWGMWNLFLLFEMVHRTNVTLMRAAQEKVKRAYAQKAKEVKEKSEKKISKKKGGEEQEEREKGSRKEERGKGVRRELKVLKEIKKYQSTTDTEIRKLPFQRVVREITQTI